MKKALKIIKKCFDIFSWILIAVLVVSVAFSLISRINGTNPSVFGYSVYRVSSGSMRPELEVGDVILGKSVKDPMSIKVGDVVTYKGRGELAGKLITHKVIEAPEEVDGEIVLRTKGVANEVADAPINADRVVSVVVCEIEFLAAFYNYFFSPWGLLTVIALIILVFIDELIAMIKTITKNDVKIEKKSIDDIIVRIQNENSSEFNSEDAEADSIDEDV
ncbi:MAG: signal peptidase I [Ruminococcus sp.]|nr:signal peptidase I [Ruminococcus sp.]